MTPSWFYITTDTTASKSTEIPNIHSLSPAGLPHPVKKTAPLTAETHLDKQILRMSHEDHIRPHVGTPAHRNAPHGAYAPHHLTSGAYTTRTHSHRMLHTTGDTGKPHPPQSLDSPTGFPPHTKAHTATHTSHPHSTCRTQNYVYTVKYLKTKDQFNMNILYNKILLLFQTMF